MGGTVVTVDDPSGAYSLRLLSTWQSGVLSSTGSLGGSEDDLKVPVACVGGAEPSVWRVKGL